ncbi:MAG TPA: glycosyltransferase [Luteibaculaceae bacterium]|nr:glycosyltransferase [Luteibaculaceae bacterium]
MPKVAVSVTNDLTTDNRVDKVCRSLQSWGFEPVLIGRQLADSLPLERPYKTKRMRLIFIRGPLFYLEYNLRLALFLLWHKFDLLHANDLDTLGANTLVSRIKSLPLIYDSHEFYTGTPELASSTWKRGVWSKLEQWCMPYPVARFTVNQSIADLYIALYGKPFFVMRNIPERSAGVVPADRSNLNLPAEAFVMVIQGAGINMDRGCEEFLEAMRRLDSDFHWMIIGNGDVVPRLKALTLNYELNHRVHFFPKMPYSQMMALTATADLGLSLDKNTNINYQFSLPNKLFDYLRAGIPVLASDLVEIKQIVEQYQVGTCFQSHDPEILAQTIRQVRADVQTLSRWRVNAVKAALELCWENEIEKLQEVYAPFISG